MKRIFCGVEFTEIEYSYHGEETQQGLFVHDTSDINGDGDGIIGNGVTLPANEDEARAILTNEYLETCFTIDSNSIYHID